MNSKAIRCGAVALVAVVLGAASAGASLANGPTITLVQGQSAPYVTGTGFTPNGAVRFKEFQLGTKAPIWAATITADSSGDIAQFGQCDGANEISFRTVDKTTGLRSNKTPYQTYLCIG